MTDFIRRTPLVYRTNESGTRGESNFYIDDNGELVDLEGNRGAVLLPSINVTPHGNSYGEVRDYNGRLMYDEYGNYYPYDDAGIKESLDWAGKRMYDAALMFTPMPEASFLTKPLIVKPFMRFVAKPIGRAFNKGMKALDLMMPGEWIPMARTAATKLGNKFEYAASKSSPFMLQKFDRAASGINKAVSATKEFTKYPRLALNNGIYGYWTGELGSSISPDNPWYVNTVLGAIAAGGTYSPLRKSYKLGKYSRGVANKYINYPFLTGLAAGAVKGIMHPVDMNPKD